MPQGGLTTRLWGLGLSKAPPRSAQEAGRGAHTAPAPHWEKYICSWGRRRLEKRVGALTPQAAAGTTGTGGQRAHHGTLALLQHYLRGKGITLPHSTDLPIVMKHAHPETMRRYGEVLDLS